jgi:D-amino-acid oxidase
MSSKPQQQKHIIILGAGITGLSTSLSLRLSPLTSPYTQTIIASHLPGDISIDYTSPNAGGHWRSFASLSNSESEIRKWDKRTYESWMAILENEYAGEEEVGLGIRESRK